MSNDLTWNEFSKVDMRVGTITKADPFTEARNPSYKLEIDFGIEIGFRKSSAQITDLYQPSDLIGKQIIAVVNFPPKQIATMMSECLILGGLGGNNGKEVTLLTSDKPIENGSKIG